MARRRGQGGLGGSWALGTPTSTFLYTTVFAAGLTIDAKAKSDRNRQWEEALSQLQDALDRPLHGTEATTEAREPAHSEQEWHQARRVASTDLEDDVALHEPKASQLDAAAQNWRDLRSDSRMPGAQALAWPANTGRDLIPHHLPPQSLWAPDTLRWTATRRRHTRKKLAMQELAAGLLIHNLIRQADLARFLNSPNTIFNRLSPQIRDVVSYTVPQAEAAHTEFLADIERLHLTDASSSAEHIANTRVSITQRAVPSYLQDADGDFYYICMQMNEGIKELFRHTGKGKVREKAVAIAKICHNLLVSTAAPDLQTFNVLLSGFTQWCRPNLVDEVIAAFFLSKIRPNELACRQILDHYTAQSRANDFSRFVAKMRGVGDALSLANPAITINEAGQGRLVRINENKVYQKVHPTPMVFAALIRGVMKFAGFDRTLDVYYEMKADGWGLAIPGLTTLLGDCIRRADWEGGTYVWEEINSIKSKVKPGHVAKVYDHMLSLCSVTGNTVAFNQVLNEVVKRGFDQKSILSAAVETTRWAQHKRDNLAPAWVADNLMIAVSSYLKDTKSSDENLPDDAEYDDRSSAQTPVEASADQMSGFKSSLSTQDNSLTSREAWSAWVEHEFGEKPKDPEP